MRSLTDAAYEMALDVSGAKSEDDQTERIIRQLKKRDDEWRKGNDILRTELERLRKEIDYQLTQRQEANATIAAAVKENERLLSGVIQEIENPCVRPVGAPGSLQRRAWEIGRMLGTLSELTFDAGVVADDIEHYIAMHPHEDLQTAARLLAKYVRNAWACLNTFQENGRSGQVADQREGGEDG